MRRLLILAALAICGGCTPVVPVTPVPQPPAPTPVPQPPPQPTPSPTGPGTITTAQLEQLPDGTSEGKLFDVAGFPFQRFMSAGFSIWVYFNGNQTIWFWVKDGKIDHRSLAP